MYVDQRHGFHSKGLMSFSAAHRWDFTELNFEEDSEAEENLVCATGNILIPNSSLQCRSS